MAAVAGPTQEATTPLMPVPITLPKVVLARIDPDISIANRPSPTADTALLKVDQL